MVVSSPEAFSSSSAEAFSSSPVVREAISSRLVSSVARLSTRGHRISLVTTAMNVDMDISSAQSHRNRMRPVVLFMIV
jgi:hypothetical protein